MRRRVLLTAGLAACLGRAAKAQDDPELSFLEYLGTWQEDDEEWLVVSDWEPGEDQADDEDDPRSRDRSATDSAETAVEDADE